VSTVQRLRRPGRRAGAVLAVAAVLGAGLTVGWSQRSRAAADPYGNVERSGCTPAVIPNGQAYPSDEQEPLRPVWCYRLGSTAPTRLSGANSWVDLFATGGALTRLADGDMDYRVFTASAGGGTRSAAFVNQNHWMADIAGGDHGGVLVRPNRSFRFEQGTLIAEGDVAAALPEYSDSAAVEIDVTTAPAPTGRVVDQQYGYGAFGGSWTFGCRFQADRRVSCALFNAGGTPGDPTVFGNELGRVWQMLPYQKVGAVTRGGEPDMVTDDRFRQCHANEMDLDCRDRFRLELTRDSVRVLVNGAPYFEQSGIAPRHQLPDEFLRSDLYVYYTSWVNRPLAAAYRCHWGRLAVNPADGSGAALPASASPSFQTNDMGDMSTPK
jgi:hypothetical protein